MSESLDRFVRDVFSDDSAEMPTQVIVSSSNGGNEGLGALPGHAVEGFIARGGMGTVYRARQVVLEREVAVKVMTGAADSPEMAARFRQEALVLGQLEHPNIVPIHELGTDEEGQLYYTMKLVNGCTLQHLLNDLREENRENGDGGFGPWRECPLAFGRGIWKKSASHVRFRRAKIECVRRDDHLESACAEADGRGGRH